MKLRLFVAINLPEDVKYKIGKEVEQINNFLKFPARFLSPCNWHLTVSFLGYQGQEKITDILDAVRETASNYDSLDIEFSNISYGPLKNSKKFPPKADSPPAEKSARMIWLNGAEVTSDAISAVKFDLEEKLVDRNVVFRRERRRYQAHITLSRFDNQKIEKLPKIEKSFNLKFQAKSLDLMQSHLKRSGAEYELISSFYFK